MAKRYTNSCNSSSSSSYFYPKLQRILWYCKKLARDTACTSTSAHCVFPLSSQTSLISLCLSPSLVVPLSPTAHTYTHATFRDAQPRRDGCMCALKQDNGDTLCKHTNADVETCLRHTITKNKQNSNNIL